MGIYATAAAAALAALVVSASSLTSAAYAQVSSGTCTIKKTEIATARTVDESSSASFVDLGEAGSITFNSAKSGCIAGTFFADAGAFESGDSVMLQVLLDGTACAPLQEYFFANSSLDFSSHSTAFFCGNDIAAGKHTIQVQYASEEGEEVEFFQRTLEVTHS